MSKNGIFPVKISLTEGDFFTLWAPEWREHGAEWQAFLGKGDDLFLFESPAHMLIFIEENASHDLSSHPKWAAFNHLGAERVVPDAKHYYDLVGLPKILADRPSYENVSHVARTFKIARSLADVMAATSVQVFFSSHSILSNAERGADHFSGDAGASEWTAIGRVVLTNWDKVVDALDEAVTIAPGVEAAALADAEARVEAGLVAAAELLEQEEARRKQEAERVDPYDTTVWAAAGIDPIKISISGRTVYTLRTYVEAQPVFLGKYGEIFTFSSSKALVRWLIEHTEHDLAMVATWEDIMTAANAGTLEVSVHPDNVYSFNGIARDIAQGPESVDKTQVLQSYELLADAADWAQDDSLNAFFLANPRMQDYISYITGGTRQVGYTPTPPYDEHTTLWTQLEEMLTKRFSRF
ncbi:hypothetical protein NXS13_02800 [Corynebacterium sp. ES2730-CONJ]|uniref:hypothetical protein n=1 Tax=Corynebacterium sp. ES2730-CONJ TaxID=2973941 RepID=UPI00216B2A54|nr:hypothetical protein [Corynebacterium sp. ES2730-CONJ]MCS4531435.1 hypothetical protein [Corynebacterium sp. ES2730-CONJ]